MFKSQDTLRCSKSWISISRKVLNPATAGLAHIFNHFYMNVYLSLSCKISVHLVYPTVIGACCLIKVSRRQNEP